MKPSLLIASLALLTSTAWASNQALDMNQNMQGSPMLDHTVGEPAHAVQQGAGEAYGSMLQQQPADHADPFKEAASDDEQPVGDS